MNVKEFFKKTTKEGVKLGGKTLVKSAFDPKTWLVVYMTILAAKAYNKLGTTLQREAQLNQAASRKIEQQVSTPEGMAAIQEQYQLTKDQVQDVIDMQREISGTQKAVMKTASDTKKSWRDWLPGAKKLREVGATTGLELDAGQAALALDAYEAAAADQRAMENAKTNTNQSARR